MLLQKEALLLLKKYSMQYPKTYILSSKNELKSIKISFPVFLKIDSNEIIHKSDYGLVFSNLSSYLEVYSKIEQAEKILREKKIENYTFVLQEKIDGKELILGMKNDKTFGKVIVFGLGGIFVEILKDISVRILPVSKKDCYEMIDEIKAKKIFEAYRNTKPINKEKLIELMLNFSKLCLNENFSEIDFNPVLANETDAYVVDARFIGG